MSALRVRFRLDFSPVCSVGPGKIALLEAIEASGSLSEAARRLNMSYRRAWLLLDSLNSAFDQRVVNLSTGGKGGGGAELTPLARELIKAYQQLEAEVLHSAQQAFANLPARARITSKACAPVRKLTRSRSE